MINPFFFSYLERVLCRPHGCKRIIIMLKDFRFDGLITAVLLFLPLSSPAQEFNEMRADSLRDAISSARGTDKAGLQLELARIIPDSDKELAREMVNSALSAARKAGDKSLEMISFYEMGKLYTTFNNIDISQAFFDSALFIAGEIEDNWYKSEILFRKGSNQHRQTEDFQALEYFNEAIKAGNLSDNYRIIGAAYSMMGTIMRVNGLYDRAIEYIIKSRLNYEKANFKDGSAWALYLLGRIYADLNLEENAREYFNEALDIYNELYEIDGRGNGVAICYEQIGLLNMKSGEYQKARDNIEYVLEIHSESNSKYGISNAYKNLGRVDYYTGNYVQAELHLEKALKIKEEISDFLSQPGIYEFIGLSQVKQGNAEEGLNTMMKGLDIAISNNQKNIQLDIYSKLADTYLDLNQPEKAISYLNKQIEIQDLSLSGAANVKMEQLQSIYEIEEKNSQIEQLEKQNEINSLLIREQKIYQVIMIIGILTVILIAIVIYWFYSRLRQKNRVLNEINVSKDKLFSIIAHDLKGPVGSSLGLSEMLTEESGDMDPEEIKNHAELIHRSINQTNNLLNNLLIWTRSQLNRIEYSPAELKLADIVAESIDSLSLQAENKLIDIETGINDSLRVKADEEMLKIILRNLISNAIKFSNPGKHVSVSAEETNSFIEISVTDRGVGMKKDDLAVLFKLESDNSKPGTSGEKGTGLGLILVKDFVEIHGGKISVESEEGKGSTFRFTVKKN